MPLKQIAGRYDVVREIGRGGMGSVWLCTDQLLGREVALKQLGGFPGKSSPQVARALREARSSAALSHPNVVSIFDAVEEGDHIWLVMEYLPSRTLSQVIHEDGAMSPQRAARIGAQVAAGLAAAHARRTIHRDVKPGNILVTDDDLAKISDFGIARTLGEDQLTQTGLVAGTPLYFSPELARGATPSPAADVWALGATLYAAVEGSPPWPTQENPIAMLMHIANNEPPRPTHAGPLADVIDQMMVVDPESRLSMEDAYERLQDVAAGDRATVPSTPADSDLHSTQALPVPVALDAPETSGGEQTVEREPAPAPAPDDGEPAQRRRGSRTLVTLVVVALLLAGVIGIALASGLGDGNDPSPAAGDESSDSTKPRTEPSNKESDTPDSTPQQSETTPPSDASETPASSPAAPVAGADDPAGFVEDYYALLPSDTRSSWRLLSPAMQDEVGSYGSYRGFWATVDSVSVDGTEVVDDGVVDVTLTYVTGQGTETETRQITVADTGGSTRIVDDSVV